MPIVVPDGVTIHHSAAGAPASVARVLTADALAFLAELERRFGDRRHELLARRRARQRDLDGGVIPGFLVETRGVRDADWTVAPTPPALERRCVEITGPVERKMMINALNSGADAFMADFEDALSPTWENVVEGQANVMDAVRGTIEFTGPDGRRYALAERVATLILRPRGWHLDERHLHVDGRAISASLFDFGLSYFHNAAERLARGEGPYYYLPKLESHLEARLWNDVFTFAEESLGIPLGSVRATVLIETILAAFEMDEILYELRDHAAGLNAGRWDYIFSIVKKFSGRPDMVLPDRAQVTMAVPFMRAYAEQLVRTCHRRGAHAMGGMAAFVPNRRDPAVTEAAVAKVREDKRREAIAGFDGTWVAHPDLVPVAMEVFAEALGDRPHQKHRGRDDVHPDAASLLSLDVPGGRVTDAGVRANVDVALLYLDAWLRGSGAVAIHNLMEDAATAEISRAQLWQWLHHRVVTADGTPLTPERYAAVRDDVLAALERERGDAPSRLRDAADLLDRLVLGSEFTEFLTIPAYEVLEPPLAVAGLDGGAVPHAEPAPVTVDAAEEAAVAATGFAGQVEALEARWRDDAVRRDYAALDVVRLRGSVRVAHTLATLGAACLRGLLARPGRLRATGVRTGGDAVHAVRGGAEAVHVRGTPAPDERVREINAALLGADRVEWSALAASGAEPRRWVVPIVADVDVSLASAATVYAVTAALIEAGAAAVRLVDGDEAPAPAPTFVRALRAARLAADVLDVPTVLIASTADSSRALAYAPYVDVVSLSGASRTASAASGFADAVHARFQGKPLARSSHATSDEGALDALGYAIVFDAPDPTRADDAERYLDLVAAAIEDASAETTQSALAAALGPIAEVGRPLAS